MDIVPGRYTYAFVKPTKQGKFRLTCAEYCGDGHSRMRTVCEVHANEEDRRKNTEWIPADHTPFENGQRLFNMNCSGCHGVNGETKTGPALNLVWGKQEKLSTGETVLVDEAYFKKSLEDPSADIVDGYDGPPSKMNSFAGKFKPEELQDLMSYIKYMNDNEKYAHFKTKAGDDGASGTGDGNEAADTTEDAENDAAAETDTAEEASETPADTEAEVGDENEDN